MDLGFAISSVCVADCCIEKGEMLQELDPDRRVYKSQAITPPSDENVYSKDKHCKELQKVSIFLQDPVWPSKKGAD